MAREMTFFSYARVDTPFVLKLAKDLRDAGAELWLDQLDIKPGSHWDSAIEKALGSANRIIVVLSKDSVASNNVMDEVSFALENGKTVIPVLLNECAPPFRLKRLQRIDFTQDYHTGLNYLLEALGEKRLDPQPADTGFVASTGAGTAVPVAPVEDPADRERWEAAQKTNTVAAYRAYAAHSVNDALKQKAELRIRDMEAEQKDRELEKLLWDKARNSSSLQAYEHYLDEYPNGTYTTQAKRAIAELKEQPRDKDNAKPVVSGGSKGGTKKIAIIVGSLLVVAVGVGAVFIGQGPDPAEVEAIDHGKIQGSTDSAAVAGFLAKHPTGAHFGKANQQLKEIVAKLAEARELEKEKARIAAEAQRLEDEGARRARLDSIRVGRYFEGGIIYSVTDDTLGHGWVVSAVDLPGPNGNSLMTWHEADTACRNYREGDHSDWILPEAAQLKEIHASIVKQAPPRLSEHFAPVKRGQGTLLYWSATPHTAGQYKQMNFSGAGSTNWYYDTSGKFRVRAVRRF